MASMSRTIVAAGLFALTAADSQAKCQTELQHLGAGHNDMELQVLCRARLPDSFCRQARKELGQQPWQEETLQDACSKWVAAWQPEEVDRILKVAALDRAPAGKKPPTKMTVPPLKSMADLPGLKGLPGMKPLDMEKSLTLKKKIQVKKKADKVSAAVGKKAKEVTDAVGDKAKLFDKSTGKASKKAAEVVEDVKSSEAAKTITKAGKKAGKAIKEIAEKYEDQDVSRKHRTSSALPRAAAALAGLALFASAVVLTRRMRRRQGSEHEALAQNAMDLETTEETTE